MELTDDGVKLVASVLALIALPVTAIAKAVNLTRDVQEFNHDAIARDAAIEERASSRLKAHEELCEERMRHLLSGQAQILKAIEHLSERE